MKQTLKIKQEKFNLRVFFMVKESNQILIDIEKISFLRYTMVFN